MPTTHGCHEDAGVGTIKCEYESLGRALRMQQQRMSFFNGSRHDRRQLKFRRKTGLGLPKSRRSFEDLKTPHGNVREVFGWAAAHMQQLISVSFLSCDQPGSQNSAGYCRQAQLSNESIQV